MKPRSIDIIYIISVISSFYKIQLLDLNNYFFIDMSRFHIFLVTFVEVEQNIYSELLKCAFSSFVIFGSFLLFAETPLMC